MNQLIATLSWMLAIAGATLAQGFWWTLASILVPPVGWYHLFDHLLGFLPQ